MIGDWVYDKHYNGDIEPIKIYNIYGNEVNCKTERNRFDVDEIVSGTYMSDLQPIPLTDEILEQNGFERVNGEYQDVFYVYDGIELLIDNEYTLFGQCKMPIKYVHELQHALRLCNITKEIVI